MPISSEKGTINNVVQKKTTKKSINTITTEEKIDDFTKLIIEKLEANYDLRNTSGTESTRVAESSRVTQIMDLPALFRGDRVKGRSIKFQVIVRA